MPLAVLKVTKSIKYDTGEDMSDVTRNPLIRMPAEQELSDFLKKKMKESSVTYEDMALQIDVSLATFKRLIKRPYEAKLSTIQALIREVGGELCIVI